MKLNQIKLVAAIALLIAGGYTQAGNVFSSNKKQSAAGKVIAYVRQNFGKVAGVTAVTAATTVAAVKVLQLAKENAGTSASQDLNDLATRCKDLELVMAQEAQMLSQLQELLKTTKVTQARLDAQVNEISMQELQQLVAPKANLHAELLAKISQQ